MAKEKKQYRLPEFVYFVFAKGQNPSYGFSTYTDTVGALGVPGKVVSISYQLDKNNRPIPYFFSVGLRDRAIKVEKEKVDMYGTSVVEFLRNSPECKGSPNGHYVNPEDPTTQVGICFKEMNEESDAENALKAKKYRQNAENICSNLELEEVHEINALFGYFNKSEMMARHYLMEIAGNKPAIFMDAYDNPQRKALSLVKRGLSKHVLKNQGTVVVWNKTTIGLDEIEAATNIQKDPKLMDALEKAVKAIV